jgi:hypothetical protein
VRVVEIGGHAQPRVEGIRGERRVVREEKRVGADDRGEIPAGVPRALRVQEGELRQGEQPVGAGEAVLSGADLLESTFGVAIVAP